MATWFLLNSIKFHGVNGAFWRLAGETINDALEPTAPIAAAGGILVPTSNAAAAAAVGTAQNPGPVIKYRKYVGEEWSRLDALMIAAVLGAVVNEEANTQFSNGAAGATVAAGAAISPNVVFTPKSSGNVRIFAWASFVALASGTCTPLLKQGATTLAAPAQLTGAASQGPYDPSLELEVTGLVVGTPVTFSWVTTAGDATVTLGHGSTGSASGLAVTEHP
jgi:hypothetical protein